MIATITIVQPSDNVGPEGRENTMECDIGNLKLLTTTRNIIADKTWIIDNNLVEKNETAQAGNYSIQVCTI